MLFRSEDRLRVIGYHHMEARLNNFDMTLGGKHLDWQIVSAAQVFRAVGTIFSAVEHLALKYYRHNMSSEWNNQADRSHWRKVLGSFEKVKTVSVDSVLVEQLSGALQVGEEESPTELLPELQNVTYPTTRRVTSRNAFTQFIDARREAGCPVTVNHS